MAASRAAGWAQGVQHGTGDRQETEGSSTLQALHFRGAAPAPFFQTVMFASPL